MPPPKKKKKQSLSAADFIAKNFKKSFNNLESKSESESKVNNVEKQIFETNDEPMPESEIERKKDSATETKLSDAFIDTTDKPDERNEPDEPLENIENKDFDDETENIQVSVSFSRFIFCVSTFRNFCYFHISKLPFFVTTSFYICKSFLHFDLSFTLSTFRNLSNNYSLFSLSLPTLQPPLLLDQSI